MALNRQPKSSMETYMTNLLPELEQRLINHANALGHDMTEFIENSDSQFLKNSRCRKCNGWLFLRWDHSPPTIESKGIPVENKCLVDCNAETSADRIARMK